MCEKCVDIDAKITRFKKLLAEVDDQTAIALLTLAVAALDSEKTALHPELANKSGGASL
jgi:hypothetical protein